jgi:cation diffusion facilitator family transporter
MKIYKVTLIGGLCNLFLLIFKLAAGLVGNSAAMIADAVHSLSDFVTDIIVVVFVKISQKPNDREHRFGHGKFETLATTIIGAVLFVVGTRICIGGVRDIWGFFNGAELEEPGTIALAAAIVSIVVKEILYHYTTKVGKELDSKAVVANAWHHRSDAFSSIGVALGIGGAILLGEQWRVLDPIAAVIVSVFIAKVAVDMLNPSVDELMEKSLPLEQEEKIKEIILSFPGVSDPHSLRTRKIGSYCAVDVHIRMDGRMPLGVAHETATDIEKKLREYLGEGSYINIHMEPSK